MAPRVTVVLVARTGAEFLERTLAALARQTRKTDAVIAVDAGSRDNSRELLAASAPTQLVDVPGAVSFTAAVTRALQAAAPTSADPSAADDNDWLWLLGHDSAPEPTALAELLAAVEIAPSVAVAGPKVMRWGQPDVIADFGQTITRLGATVHLVEGELDQGQHDVHADVLGVAARGMLVRRSLWNALGGFDPALPGTDSGLDFSLRARLAGHRVILVPSARIAGEQSPAAFGQRHASEVRRNRLVRTAQLHRRLVYAPLWAVLFHWLSLVPLAVLRSIGHLLTKRPAAIGGEFRAAFSAAFTGRVLRARRNFRRSKVSGWAAVAALRMPWREVRERRAQVREAYLHTLERPQEEEPAGFLADGGFWVTVAAAIVGLVLFGGLLSAQSLTGGGLAPLSTHLADLWENARYGWHDIGGGFVGAADPFVFVLALLGSLAFWAPSFGIVLFYVAALPLAALGAWYCARRFSRRTWLPALAAVLWMFAPPFLGSLATGRLGASIAQVLLPWLVLALVNAARSWAAAAAAALLFAAVSASAPSLAPPLLVLWLVWLFARPKSVHHVIGIPIPALALFAPLIVQQFLRGNPLALLADPGLPVAGGTSSGWRLALGDAGLGAAPGALHGWSRALDALALPGVAAPTVVAALLLPFGALALLALFVPGSHRAIPALGIALLGYASAVAVSRIEVSLAGTTTVPVWPGAALSLFWLGLIGAALVALDALGRPAAASAFVAGLASLVLALPLLGVIVGGGASVQPGTGRILPALATARAEVRPSVGTLLLAPSGDAAIGAELARGAGETLDEQSTLAATDTSFNSADRRLANLAGNLVSRSGFDAKADLHALDIGFVVLADAPGDDGLHARAVGALDGNSLLIPVGHTADGMLWSVSQPPAKAPRLQPKDTGEQLGLGILLAQGGIFGATLLLGIPTARRRKRRVPVSGSRPRPLDEFAEEDDD